jgi:hypothetical protein
VPRTSQVGRIGASSGRILELIQRLIEVQKSFVHKIIDPPGSPPGGFVFGTRLAVLALILCQHFLNRYFVLGAVLARFLTGLSSLRMPSCKSHSPLPCCGISRPFCNQVRARVRHGVFVFSQKYARARYGVLPAHVIQSSVDVTFRSANNEFRRATSVKSEPRPIILKLVLDLDLEKLVQFVGRLRRMNVNSAVLFPGLDGFARSLGEQLIHFRELATGGPPGTMQR